MNPLASSKFSARLFMGLAAIVSALFIASCGGSSSPSTLSTIGFTQGSLKGTYVIFISGEDVNLTAETESTFAIAGTITTDGNGNIMGGTVDVNDPNLGGNGVFPGLTVSKSTYSVSADGRGAGTLKVTINSTAEAFGIDFVLTSSSHGLITRFDLGGSGSGTIDLQTSATQGSLTSLAFSLNGEDATFDPLAAVGGFTLNSSGSITSGKEDFNDFGSSAGLTDLSLTSGSQLLLTSSTAGTAQFNTASATFPSLAFDVWVIDSTHLKLIETDTATTGVSLAGDAYTQQTSFTAGQLVYTLGGFDSSKNPFAAGGYATTDVNGNLSAGIEDYNDDGTPVAEVPFTTTCNATAPFANGRCQLVTTGLTNGPTSNLQFAAYPSSGGVLLLEDDSSGSLAQGVAYAQSATAFTVPGSYGLNLSGVNSNPEDNGEVDDIAQFNATSATSSNMTGEMDENAIANTLFSNQSLSGTYTPDSPADGRGSIAIPSIHTFDGTLNLEYYVVDASTAIFIDVDSTASGAPQVATGTFEAQTVPGAAAVAHPAISTARPIARPRGANARRK